MEYSTKKLLLNSTWVRLQIWDTAGNERFRPTIARELAAKLLRLQRSQGAELSLLCAACYRGAAGIVLMYDVSDEDTFTGIRRWLRHINQHASEIYHSKVRSRH